MFRASLRPSSGEQNCVPLPMLSCPSYGCCGSGETGSEMCALCRGFGRAHIETQADAGQGDAARETLRDTV